MSENNKGGGITRRDLLKGLALAISVPGMLTTEQSLASSFTDTGTIVKAKNTTATALRDVVSSYPPEKTGLRGAHVGSFEVAHQMRDGQQPIPIKESGQHYDLVVVGAGISGMSAAWMYRQKHPHARILILDNHDDFGGHAKRNEFHLNGTLHLMNGGTFSIQSPRPYSKVAESMFHSLGIDAQDLSKRIQNIHFYDKLNLSESLFFDAATFGKNVLIRTAPGVKWKKILSNAPLGSKARKDIERIEEELVDYLPKLNSDQKKEKLSQMSYRDFLLNVVKADPEVIKFYQQRTHDEFCVGIDAVSALDCWALEMPGFQGMNLSPGSIPRMGPTASGFADTGGSVEVHLPDGGATVARSLVRALIPAAIPGHTVDDITTARVNYSLLDRPENNIRIRLNSTVVRVQNIKDQGKDKKRPGGVRVEYISAAAAAAAGKGGAGDAGDAGNAGHAVHANHCVMACWNMVIPYLCPELPEPQKKALKSLVKAPLVYCSVALRNWKAFEQLGIARIHAPGAYFSDIWLNEWVNIGKYHTPHSSADPIILHMISTPCAPGLDATSQMRIGRAKLLETSLDTFQATIRQQLDAMLGKAGFNSEKDILAITVNRWPHGYSFEYNPLLAPPSAPGAAPYEIGRQRFGSIVIANADSGGLAFMDAAVDQAHRAVTELLEATV